MNASWAVCRLQSAKSHVTSCKSTFVFASSDQATGAPGVGDWSCPAKNDRNTWFIPELRLQTIWHWSCDPEDGGSLAKSTNPSLNELIFPSDHGAFEGQGRQASPPAISALLALRSACCTVSLTVGVAVVPTCLIVQS